MARKGRKPKTREQKLRDAFERTKPADYILERRSLFSFVEAPKGGEIDSEICDAIGQLCVLGLLDNNGYDPVDLRDKGRFWGGHYAKLMKGVGVKTGSYERRDKSHSTGALTGEDIMFDRMDGALSSHERRVLLSLVVDPLIGHHENVPWAQCLIDEALLKRGRIRRGCVEFPSEHDRGLLQAAIRGLCQIAEGSLRPRWAA